MAQPHSWVDEVHEALTEIGGDGSLAEIYNQIRTRDVMNFVSNKNWKAAVRQTLETHSSDSEAFRNYGDYFYSVYGIGQGHWGLRTKKSQTSA